MPAFPRDLIPVIRQYCRKRKQHSFPPIVRLPSDNVLEAFLDIAFHASFLTEEGRRPGFRVALIEPRGAPIGPGHRYFQNQDRQIVFNPDRPYAIAEINRLSPAADVIRTIIGVWDRGTRGTPDLRIWGLLDVGENWHRFTRHETSGGRTPPRALTITSLNAGELSISIAGWVLCTLREGCISFPTSNALWEGPLNDFLASAQKDLYLAVIRDLGATRWDEEGDDDDYPQRAYLFFLERVLAQVREKRHGGTLLIIPDHLSHNDTRITDRVRVKYSCNYDYAWELLMRNLIHHNRYYDLHFKLWDRKTRLAVDTFKEHHLLDSEGQKIEEALADVSRMIATLSAVDGAVLMTDRFRVVGFGAEVIAISPSLRMVSIYSGGVKKEVSIESFGTRHRSAFRFCSSLEDCAAFIVSQDGGVKAVKRVGADVFLWPDINAGRMGI